MAFRLFLTGLAVFVLGACSKSSTSAGGTGTLQMAVRASNAGSAGSTYLGLRHRLNKNRAGLRTSTSEPDLPTPSQSLDTANVAGAPDTFTISITKMSLNGTQTDGNQYSIPIFSDPTGKPINISGSSVDLTSLFTTFTCIDNNGNPYTGTLSCACGFDSSNNPLATTTYQGRTVCPQDVPGANVKVGSGGSVATLEANAGTYTSLTVEVLEKAQVSGCITGDFNPGLGSGVPIHNQQTYCTQTALSSYLGGAANSSSFQGVTEQVMDLDLGNPAGAQSGSAAGTFDLTFNLSKNFTLSNGGSTPLTLVIDTNRMFQFFVHENINGGSGPISSVGNTASYFWAGDLAESAYIFAGLPGSIYGFQLVEMACITNGAVPTTVNYTNYDCSGDPNQGGATPENIGYVAGWLTVIVDSTGTPFMANLVPDDADALVVLKGGTTNSSGSWQTSAISQNTDGTYNITFNEQGSTGTLMNLNLSASVTTSLDTATSIPNMFFNGFNSSWTAVGGATQSEPTFGLVTAWRRL